MTNASTKTTFDPVANTRDRLGVSALEAQALYWITTITLYVVLVANQTHIETMDAIKLAPRLEMMVRLGGTALAGLIGVYGALCIGRVQKAMLSFPGIWITGIAGCYVMGTLFSEYKSVAVPHLVTFGCIFLFAPTAFAIMGTRRFVQVTLLALLTTLIASWFLYLFMPAYGVTLEVTDGDTGEGVFRMGGTSHPNTLAGVAGFVLMIICYLLFEKKTTISKFLPIALICLATYIFTQTRVAAAGAILALAFAYRGFWFRRSVFPVTMFLVMLGVALVSFMMIQGAGIGAEAFTRSGDIEEITSFTGRNEIWSYIVQKIGESPMVGYGPGVSKVLLDSQDMLLHPHNVVLSLAVVGGLFCGIFGAMMFLQQLTIAWSSTARLAVMITIYVFLNSLTESFVFDYIPGTTTILWMAALYWPVLDDDSL